MTLDELDQLFNECDSTSKEAMRRSGDNPPCKSGCFFCCKEPVYCTNIEVKGMLSLLTEQQRDSLAARVALWRDLFMSSGLHLTDECPVVPYRTLNAWCPFLSDDKTCSVYSRRPCGCRLHVAKTSSEGCEHDDKRLHQTYIFFPGLGEQINRRFWQKIADGEKLVYDHLGLLLFEALFGVETMTNSRVEAYYQGDDLIIKTREPEKFKAAVKSHEPDIRR